MSISIPLIIENQFVINKTTKGKEKSTMKSNSTTRRILIKGVENVYNQDFLYVKRNRQKQQGFIDYHLRCETHGDKSNS
jgi:hypothetical protein